MELREDESIQNYGKKCGHCIRNTILPNGFEFTCFTC